MLPWVTFLRGEKGEGQKGPSGPPSPVCEMEGRDVGWSVWTLLVSNPMSPWKKGMVHPGESETEGATHMNTQRDEERDQEHRCPESGEVQVPGAASSVWVGFVSGVWGQTGHRVWHFRVLVNDLGVETGLGISSCRFRYHFPKDVSWW